MAHAVSAQRNKLTIEILQHCGWNVQFKNCLSLAKIVDNILPGKDWQLPSLNTHTHITSHHGRRLCEPFNIWLNNAAAFHKPGDVPGLIPGLIPGLAAWRSLSERYQEYLFFFHITLISLFSPYFPLCPPFPVSHLSSPPAAPLIIRCSCFFTPTSLCLCGSWAHSLSL